MPEVLRQIRTYLPEVLRQIRSYLPEDLRQIRSYLPEVFRQIVPYLLEPFLSYTVLNGPAQSYLVFYYTVWYYTVLKVSYCCIMVLFSLVLYGRARSCIDFPGIVWSIRSCQVLYDIVKNYTVLEGPVCSCRFMFGHTLSSV